VAAGTASAAAMARPMRGPVTVRKTPRVHALSTSASRMATAAGGSCATPNRVRRWRMSADKLGRSAFFTPELSPAGGVACGIILRMPQVLCGTPISKWKARRSFLRRAFHTLRATALFISLSDSQTQLNLLGSLAHF
jgi:hypothetical protein